MKRALNKISRPYIIKAIHESPDGYIVEIKPPTRSLQANAALWAALNDIANQVIWWGRKLSPEDWKSVFTASLKKQDVVPGLHNDFVVLGTSTSKMTVSEMSDLLELIFSFGAEHDVKFGARDEI